MKNWVRISTGIIRFTPDKSQEQQQSVKIQLKEKSFRANKVWEPKSMWGKLFYKQIKPIKIQHESHLLSRNLLEIKRKHKQTFWSSTWRKYFIENNWSKMNFLMRIVSDYFSAPNSSISIIILFPKIYFPQLMVKSSLGHISLRHILNEITRSSNRRKSVRAQWLQFLFPKKGKERRI